MMFDMNSILHRDTLADQRLEQETNEFTFRIISNTV